MYDTRDHPRVALAGVVQQAGEEDLGIGLATRPQCRDDVEPVAPVRDVHPVEHRELLRDSATPRRRLAPAAGTRASRWRFGLSDLGEPPGRRARPHAGSSRPDPTTRLMSGSSTSPKTTLISVRPPKSGRNIAPRRMKIPYCSRTARTWQARPRVEERVQHLRAVQRRDRDEVEDHQQQVDLDEEEEDARRAAARPSPSRSM